MYIAEKDRSSDDLDSDFDKHDFVSNHSKNRTIDKKQRMSNLFEEARQNEDPNPF